VQNVHNFIGSVEIISFLLVRRVISPHPISFPLPV